jgi:cysteine desulfurase
MSQAKIYYFDNNSTTRVAPEVIEAMIPFLADFWGNPSSAYSFSTVVSKQLDKARESVASLITADPREIVLTSCGTESNNSVIQSAIHLDPQKRHLVTTAVEHSSNLQLGKSLQKRGYDVTFLPVESDGSLDLHLLEQSIRPDTAIVSVMWANNETGVLFPIEEVSAICRSKGVLCHTDAVQTPGKLKIDVRSMGVDYLSLSAHKLHAPKGVGLLYVKRRARYEPYLIGGHQERGRRGGTENVASIIGFGRAAELAMATLGDENTRVRSLRDRMENTILRTIPNSFLNGAKDARLPNTSNIAFDSVEAEAVLMLLDHDGICASSGSACTTGSLEPSHVLTAMGIHPRRARGSVRFSLGIYNNDDDVEYLLKQLPPIIQKLRGASPDAEEYDGKRKSDSISPRREQPLTHKLSPKC